MENKKSDFYAKALRYEELIDYQRGSIVSMTLIDKKTGTVTVFAFDRGQGLSEHTAPFDALVQVVDGKANVTIGGTDHLVQAGQSIIMPANIPHALQAEDDRFKMVLIMIRDK